MMKKRTKKRKISYEECDKLVLAYRDNNDPDAAQALLDAFEGYMAKYYNVIRHGKVAIHDRDIREFIKLYMKNEYCRRHIHQYRRMPVVQQEIYSVADSIRKLCQPYSDDELMNEIYVAFLTMAKRYQSPDGKPRFHSYILRAFHYQLRRQLQTLVSDPIVFKMASNVKYLDDQWEGDDYSYGRFDAEGFEDKRPTFTIESSLDAINDNWVLGYTTGQEYRDLSIMERKILKMYYIDDMSDQEIADQLGTCRATVNRRRNKALRILERALRRSGKLSRQVGEAHE